VPPAKQTELSLLHAALLCIALLTGAAALSIEDLPTHPENDCAGDAVTAAFGKCLLRGATPACCNGLDSVYANSSRHSFG
jgi:hypothetical protein